MIFVRNPWRKWQFHKHSTPHMWTLVCVDGSSNNTCEAFGADRDRIRFRVITRVRVLVSFEIMSAERHKNHSRHWLSNCSAREISKYDAPASRRPLVFFQKDNTAHESRINAHTAYLFDYHRRTG